MEVKGAGRCRPSWTTADEPDDYVEIGPTPASAATLCATTSIRYAAAYAIATPLSNLFGKCKDPFWQPADTDLL